MIDDAIVAITTPRGVSGVAKVRLSGENVKEILQKLTNYNLDSIAKNSFAYLRLHYFNSEKLLDDVVVLYFALPNSYTGEDVYEIDCHGSVVIPELIVSEFIKAGARQAEAGEFTSRAFINGKLNLLEAEKVGSLLYSTASHQAEYIQNNDIISKLSDIKQNILQTTSHILAVLDFPDDGVDDIDIEKINKDILDEKNKLDEIIKNADNGIISANGLNVVILGEPNSGKSSLLNLFLGEEKAIVTDIEGTTRDILQYSINLSGFAVNFFDTAGLRETIDKVEAIGIDKAYEVAGKADLILYIFDNTKNEFEIKYNVKEHQRVIKILNKQDLCDEVKQNDAVLLSIKTGFGFDKLKDMVYNICKSALDSGNSVWNLRQKDLVLRIAKNLDLAILEEMIDMKLLALENALAVFGELDGTSVSDEIIENIFDKFCVGK